MRIPILLTVVVLSACSSVKPVRWLAPYKMEIQQGNYITADTIAKLQPGMTRAQVRFLLGSPLLTHAFHANRWDYIYWDVKQGHLDPASNKRLTVYFNADGVQRIEGEGQPAGQPETAQPILPQSNIKADVSSATVHERPPGRHKRDVDIAE